MKFTDLKPQWLISGDERVALMFLCPHCVTAGKKEQWLTCFFKPAGKLPKDTDGWPGDRELFKAAFQQMGHADPEHESWRVVSCRHDIAWTKTSDDLASISVTPSVDASGSGHWHGFITNGEAT